MVANFLISETRLACIAVVPRVGTDRGTIHLQPASVYVASSIYLAGTIPSLTMTRLSHDR